MDSLAMVDIPKGAGQKGVPKKRRKNIACKTDTKIFCTERIADGDLPCSSQSYQSDVHSLGDDAIHVAHCVTQRNPIPLTSTLL